MTDSTRSELIKSHETLSLLMIRSRTVPMAAVIELLEQLHDETTQHDSLEYWVTTVSSSDRIFERSLATAALTSWMFHHQPMPLMNWQDVAIAAAFMDLGYFALTQPDRRQPSATVDIPHINQTHADVGAALISSVTGIPSSVRQMIRHHHERLDGTGYPHKLTSTDLHLSDRLLAVAAQTIAGLSGGTGQHLVHNVVANQLVTETRAGAWDLTFVEPVLNALAIVANPTLSSKLYVPEQRYRIDGRTNIPSAPHQSLSLRQEIQTVDSLCDERNTNPLHLNGPHFRLSEQSYVKKPLAVPAFSQHREDPPSR